MRQRLSLRTVLEAQFRASFLESIAGEPDILFTFWFWHICVIFWQAWLTTQLCKTCPWTCKHNILLLSVCEDLVFIASQGPRQFHIITFPLAAWQGFLSYLSWPHARCLLTDSKKCDSPLRQHIKNYKQTKHKLKRCMRPGVKQKLDFLTVHLWSLL